jgi:4'-phosphopantetheinyl transferase
MSATLVPLDAGVYVAFDRICRDPVRWRAVERGAARALLRRLLAAVAGPAAARAPLGARERGQPYLVGRPDLEISLSHSDGLVAAAVHTGAGPVGVDIQAPHPVGDRLVRRCCPRHAAELLRLPSPDRDRELAWIWTVQESCAKATGAGLALRPWTIPVAPGHTRGGWRSLRWQALRACSPTPLSCAYGLS